MKPLIENVLFDFLNTAVGLEQRLDRALSIRGISFSEYKLLNALAEYSDLGRPRGALAMQVGLTPSAITRALKPLEKLGYVETAKNQRDARQRLAIITDAGMELHRDARSVVTDVLNNLSISAATKNQIQAFSVRLADIRSSQG